MQAVSVQTTIKAQMETRCGIEQSCGGDAEGPPGHGYYFFVIG